MIDKNTNAAKSFFKAVRTFAERTKAWEVAIFYEIKPDEKHDLTLVSQRIYGNRHESLAVMAAAGLDTVNQPLKQTRIILPTPGQLAAMKRKTGFESDPDNRKNYEPTWLPKN